MPGIHSLLFCCRLHHRSFTMTATSSASTLAVVTTPLGLVGACYPCSSSCSFCCRRLSLWSCCPAATSRLASHVVFAAGLAAAVVVIVSLRDTQSAKTMLWRLRVLFIFTVAYEAVWRHHRVELCCRASLVGWCGLIAPSRSGYYLL